MGTTSGVFKDTMTGSVSECFLAKFDTLGNRIWVTYLGSNGGNSVLDPGIALDPQGNIVVFGNTQGGQDNMGTIGTFRPQKDPNLDTISLIYYLAKFSPSGQRIWGTYLNANPRDTAGLTPSALAIDKLGNIYLGGRAQPIFSTLGTVSPFPFPPTGAYSPENTDLSAENAFLIKFDSAGRLSWGTYYGGTQIDFCTQLTTDEDGNVYMVGVSNSDTGIATTGANYPYRRSQTDYETFIVKFNPQGQRLWGTYTNGLSIFGGVITDDSNDLYLLGTTSLDTGIGTPNAYQPFRADSLDFTLTKWSKDGQRIWGTYFGGLGSERIYQGQPNNLSMLNIISLGPGQITMDRDQNLLITGFTTSATGIRFGCTYTPNLPNHQKPGGFMAKFYPNGQLMWGSYFEVGNFSIVSANKGTSFYMLSTTDMDSLGTSGTFMEFKPQGINNPLLLTKMEGDYVCPEIHLSIQNTDNLLEIDPGYNSYQWYFNGNPISGANNYSFQAQQTGNYWVTFENNCGCNYTSDTLFVEQVTGINDLFNHNGAFNIYPNPGRDFFYLKNNVLKPGTEVYLSITDVFGKNLIKTSFLVTNLVTNYRINTNRLVPGLYFVHIISGNQQQVLKLTIEK